MTKQRSIYFSILLLLISFFSTNAQYNSKFSVDLNLVSCTEFSGLYKTYSYDWAFVPGFKINYASSKHVNYFVGLRQVSTVSKDGGIDSYEETASKGAEMRIGAGISTNNEKRIYLTLSVEGFLEVSTLKGTYMPGPPSPGEPFEYEINHWRSYFGFAPSFAVTFNLTDRLALFVDTRYRFGKMNFTGTEATRWGYTLYRDRSTWMGLYAPLNGFGVRIKL